MATGDFGWLKQQLAFMAGRNSVAELDSNPNVPSDSLLAGQCVNEAYFDCYMNPSDQPGGKVKRPGWALQQAGIQYEAPQTLTLNMVQGSNVFTGDAPDIKKAGSVMQIGSGFYRYGGQVGAGATIPTNLIGQSGQVALVAGQQSYVVTYATPFLITPSFVNAQVFMANSSGEVFYCSIDQSTRTSTGFTVWLDGIPTALSSGAYINWNAAGTAGISPVTGAYQIVEPFAEPTGTYQATIWHNSYVLPATSVELEFGPLVLGWGLLRPMNGRVEEVKWRQITYGDFWQPTPFGVGQMTSINWPGGVSNPTGTPIFYYIDDSTLVPNAPIASRMIIWPLPTQLTTVQYQAWVTPLELTADADLPIMPANLITRCLLPLCRERWALIYKKYTGGNQAALIKEGDRARAILENTFAGQRDKAIRMPLLNC